MLFLSYWELKETFTPRDVAKLAAELMEKKLWPVEGVKILGWYITCDVPHWGITLEEAETVEQVMKGALVWENAKPGLFKMLKVSPAMTAEDAIPLVMEL
ncbi:MAG: hypothetical protein OEY39_00355 [Candidatus Bathyarchaeota archaeon]|nr:hypothetical protein [Candidatus Bathyarchaeota archaeon]MDH5622909.1 hypothetical protein [Candidatus Bathyarchaeota archaeon]MDH5635320.1 hypothetical protein [Candidatus Bathyarchaeota archaeon]MDH5701159.1 hypothetical protein [Candidatus Bathyarchaeota archaeon]